MVTMIERLGRWARHLRRRWCRHRRWAPVYGDARYRSRCRACGVKSYAPATVTLDRRARKIEDIV